MENFTETTKKKKKYIKYKTYEKSGIYHLKGQFNSRDLDMYCHRTSGAMFSIKAAGAFKRRVRGDRATWGGAPERLI